jgi:hypothetical protein
LRAVAKREMSPISAARVSPSSSATPGIVISSLGALIGAGVRPQLALERREPTVEVVDDAQQRGD